MAEGKLENIFLVNAPAGSGKTTKIRKMVSDNLEKNPQDNILCITYTNRAADELKKEIDSEQVWIGTIHAFLNDMVSPYFGRKEIIELYFSCFKEEIDTRCKNLDGRRTEGNQKYKQKYGITGELTVDEIKKHIEKLEYGETQFTSYYYGKLSHDDLIRFSYEMLEKYPSVGRKIVMRYRMIFLDEYQDTDTMVLKMFYNTLKNSPNTKLYILGDKMQQIYSNYDGGFEREFASFDTSIRLQYNYRSTLQIVNILNRLYNETEFFQQVPTEHRGWTGQYEPEIIITDDVANQLDRKKRQIPDGLILYLSNGSRFKDIGAEKLYRVYSRMGKYSVGKKYSVAQVLQMPLDEQVDDFLKMMLLIDVILQFYNRRNYGSMLRMLKDNGKWFERTTFCLERHSDKMRIRNIADALQREYEDNISIGSFVNYLETQKIINEECLKGMREDVDYNALWDVSLEEVHNLFKYLSEPHVSTQHGVKGESHDTVFFVAEDSNSTINVRMYKFFELWSKCEFSLPEFEEFYYKYREDVLKIEEKVNIGSIKAPEYSTYKSDIDKKVDEIMGKYAGDKFFQILCKLEYENYQQSRNIKSVKECFKKNLNTVYGTLQAYRIFYVGCSRARRNLTILAEKSKIAAFEEDFVNKAEETGFRVYR